MQEQQATNPVEVAQPLTLDDKIAAKFGLDDGPPETEEQATQEATPETEESEEASEEPQIEDEGEAPPTEEFVEIKHNGEVKRLSKEQLRDYASKGFDYESKMVEIKAERQKAQEYANAVKARESLVPAIVDHVAEVKAFENALKAYGNVDWVKYSNDDPIQAFQERQKFDQLVNGYNTAQQKANEAIQQHSQAEKAMSEAELDAERKALRDKVPAWKNQENYNKEWPEIVKWAESRLGEAEFQKVLPFMNSHLLSYFLRSTWKYEKALEASKSTKPAVPGMPKPGSPSPRLSKSEAIKEGIKKVHQAKDPKARAALLDEVIARKFGG